MTDLSATVERLAGSSDEFVVQGNRDTVPWNNLTVRAYDEDNHIFYSATNNGEYSIGSCFVGAPIIGADDSTTDKLRSALGMPLPPGSFVQIGKLNAPDVDAFFDCYLFTEVQARRWNFGKPEFTDMQPVVPHRMMRAAAPKGVRQDAAQAVTATDPGSLPQPDEIKLD